MKKFFEDDELELRSVASTWSIDDLLSQEGIFYLKDILGLLDLEVAKCKRASRDLEAAGKDPWGEAGLRKIWNHWVVRMTVFAPFYREKLASKFQKVDPDWDGNTLLEQNGLFLLADVVQLIPFSAHQLRYQAKKYQNPRTQIGVYKDPSIGGYVVDMGIFSPWIKRVWGETGASRTDEAPDGNRSG